MAAPIRYEWDSNNTNTGPLAPALLSDGYPVGAIPGSAEFNELWRNVTLLAAQAPSTSEIKITMDPNPPWLSFGWFKYVDGTIGNAASGGTTRANADTEALFTLIWNNTINGDCPVTPSGRGASAAADFAANKQIQLAIMNGHVIGNAANLALYRLAQSVGSPTNTLVVANLPPHQHTYDKAINAEPQDGSDTGCLTAVTPTATSDGSDHGLLSTPHNIMQPTTFFYIFMKL